MSIRNNKKYDPDFIEQLRKSPESENIEFKKNYNGHKAIGEYISGLANATALSGDKYAYMTWGIDDTTREIVGTRFKPSTKMVKELQLEKWLRKYLSNGVQFNFYELEVDGKNVVLLEVSPALQAPVSFERKRFDRIGESLTLLAPGREQQLWSILKDDHFEDQIARDRVNDEEVLNLLDIDEYFNLLDDQQVPTDKNRVLKFLERDGLIASDFGQWNITNLGAILLARNLADFPSLERKAVRVIQYEGKGKTKFLKEGEAIRGYAVGINELLDYIEDQLPMEDAVQGGVRKSVQKFPIKEAIRELVANALIHQDFSIAGTGPTVEIFDDRIEITNPGKPLIDTQQFVNEHPRSRNEKLAREMRLFKICEERGSGIDRVIAEIELRQLPAPTFESTGNSTRVKLFSFRPTQMMSKSEINRACYWHACLKYAESDHLTNASLRARFGIEDKNKATVSRHIREAVKAGLIKPFDKDASKKTMRYVPFWA